MEQEPINLSETLDFEPAIQEGLRLGFEAGLRVLQGVDWKVWAALGVLMVISWLLSPK
ncbi:MAG TPA: hypothetical protein VIG60_03610 [Savagea sp.]